MLISNEYLSKLTHHMCTPRNCQLPPDILPERFCRYRVLPKLIDLWKFGGCGAVTLTPLLKIAKSLSAEEYNLTITPVIVAAFSSSDRTTRVYLLKNIDKFIDSIDDKVLNKSVYPPVCSGFNDTNPAVREQTVKAMLFLGPKLNEANLNMDLMKHWGRRGILSGNIFFFA